MNERHNVRRLLAATLLAMACAPAAPSTPPAPPASPVRPASPAPEQNISIEAVEAANPVVITGRARTFENHVTLRVRDARGALIAETFTIATGEMGQHSPFRGTVWLTRAPGASIKVEALEYSARDGSEQSLVSVTRPYAVEPVDIRLYLPDANCTGVAPVTRRLPKSISMARLLLEALIADAATPFPKGSRVESVNLRDGILTVDFNERLQNVGGSCAAQMIRQSVTRTLQTLPSVQKVVIRAGGSEALALQP
jgi:hypothetical protein